MRRDTAGTLAERVSGVGIDVRVAEVVPRFEDAVARAAVPVVDGSRAVALLTRASLFFELGHQFGYALWRDRPVRALLAALRPSFDAIPADTTPEDAADRVRERPEERRFDPYVVEDAEGAYVGLLPIDLLLSQITLPKRVAASRASERLLAQISARERAEAASAEWRDRYETAIRATGRVLYEWNPADGARAQAGNLTEVLGLSLEEAPADLGGWLLLVHPEDRARVSTELHAAARTRSAVDLEYRVRRGDGTWALVRDDGRFVGHGDGERARLVGFLADVTERRLLEERSRQAQKMEALGRVAAGVAHDVNNVLTVVLGYAGLLISQLDGSPLRAEAEEIANAGKRGAALTRQLLAFSRKQVLEPADLDLNVLVTDAARMLRRLVGEGVRMEVDLSPEPAGVRADRGQLEQVLMNLAVNARDAMPGGGRLLLETRCVTLPADELAAGDYVRLRVVDDGQGMDDATREHLFEPFFTTKERGKGTGLGLATVYGIVRQAGGSISIQTASGAGTGVSIFLPRTRGAGAHETEYEPASQSPARAATILLAEDDPAVRAMAQGVLLKAGFRVLAAPDGEYALRMLDAYAGRLDVLLTDVVMPGLSGPKLAQRVLASRPGVRVLLMSGYPDDELGPHAIATLDASFLAKPFTSQVLTGRVGELLARESSPRSPGA